MPERVCGDHTPCLKRGVPLLMTRPGFDEAYVGALRVNRRDSAIYAALPGPRADALRVEADPGVHAVLLGPLVDPFRVRTFQIRRQGEHHCRVEVYECTLATGVRSKHSLDHRGEGELLRREDRDLDGIAYWQRPGRLVRGAARSHSKARAHNMFPSSQAQFAKTRDLLPRAGEPHGYAFHRLARHKWGEPLVGPYPAQVPRSVDLKMAMRELVPLDRQLER